jgi:hypothetical protein
MKEHGGTDHVLVLSCRFPAFPGVTRRCGMRETPALKRVLPGACAICGGTNPGNRVKVNTGVQPVIDESVYAVVKRFRKEVA